MDRVDGCLSVPCGTDSMVGSADSSNLYRGAGLISVALTDAAVFKSEGVFNVQK